MKKVSIIISFISYFQCALLSQSEMGVTLGPNTIGSSPNASSLGEYADVPVSLYTGVPDISVPIYDIKSGALNLPISLSYHAQGVKVEEAATDVGLGWTLNAGGAIIRAVRGLPDDWSGTIPNGNSCGYSFGSSAGSPTSFGSGYLNIPNYVDWISPPTSTSADIFTGFLYRGAVGELDYEPDMFYFNFAGYSGQFVFDRWGVPHLLSQSDISITPNFTSNQIGKPIIGFTIITPDGTKFYFSDIETSSVMQFNLHNYDAIGAGLNLDSDPYYHFYDLNSYSIYGTKTFNSAWYLSKIESSTSNNSITLTYNSTKQIYLTGLSQNVRPNLAIYSTNYVGWPNRSVSYLATHITGKSLSKIAFVDGEVDFNYNHQRQDVGGLPIAVSAELPNLALTTSNSYALTDISIKNIALTDIKKYQLGYGYFQSTNIISANASFNTRMACYLKRLKLQTIQEISPVSGVNPKPAHQFIYDETNPLPFLFSFQQDYWGYYNGNTGATSLLPIVYYHPNNLPSPLYGSRSSIYPWSSNSGELYLNGVYSLAGHQYSNRSPNSTYMKSGSLTKIIYPTKGETNFIYEPNDFYLDGQNRIGGGLRIKTQTMYDGFDHTKDMIKNYNYTQTLNPALSAGKVFYIPQFCRDVVVSVSPTISNSPGDIYSNSLCQLGSTNGNVVGYSEVTTDFNGIGKTTSTFAVPASFGVETEGCPNGGGTCLYNRTHRTPFYTSNAADPDDYPFTSNPNYNFARGSLLKEEVYNNNNVLVNRSLNEYQILSTDANIPALKCIYSSWYDCTNGGYHIDYSRYYHISAWYAQTKKTTELYDPAFPTSKLTTVENYFYDNPSHKLLSRTVTTDSRNKVFTSQTLYPQDYTSLSSLYTPALSTMINTKHMHNYPVEQLVYEGDSINYKMFTNYINGTKLLSGKLNTYVDFQSSSGSTNANQILLAKNHVLETSTPVSLVNFSETNRLALYKEQSNLFYDSKDNLIKYRYLNGGLYNNATYIWGHNQQYPIAKVANASETDCGFTSFESDDQNVWTYNPPVTLVTTDGHCGASSRLIPPNTFGPTRTYTPSVGTQTKKFILSCWVKTNSNVAGAIGSLVLTTSNLTSGAMYPNVPDAYRATSIYNTNGAWQYLEVEIDLGKIKTLGSVPASTILRIGSFVWNTGATDNILVDDIRFYPKEARMSTCTYLPMVGKSSETNENNQSMFYEYDEYNRLSITRDDVKNIINKTEYNYKP